MRYALLVLMFGLAGCHGIEHPAAPTPVPARSQTPVVLHLVASPGVLPVGGGSAAIIVEALGSDGLGVETSVALSASGGELGLTELRTDKTGHVTGSWAGTASSTLTARAGEVIAVLSLKVNEPVVLPPPSVPPVPTPIPPLPPQPTPAPVPALTLSASPSPVAVGTPVTFTASASNLNAGETITAYQWFWEGTGTTPDETTIAAARQHVYTVDGIKTPLVIALTSSGRSAVGRLSLIAFRP